MNHKQFIIPIIFLTTCISLPASAAVLEEIVVTAQKREQNLQDIGVSVSVFDGDTIRNLGVRNAEEIVEFIAGVQMNNTNGNSTPTFVVRGIGIQDFMGNSAPAAAVHVDGIYMASNINSGPQLFDIERMEILKGPQGTLYGRNNTAGTINVISKKPGQEQDGYLTASYAEDEDVLIEGAIGGGISENLSYRFSARYENSGGFWDNENLPAGIEAAPQEPIFASAALGNTPLPAGTDNELGDIDVYALRGQLLYEPDDSLSVLFKGHYSNDSSQQAPLTFVVTGAPAIDPVTFLQLPCSTIVANPIDGIIDGGTSDPSVCVDGSGAVEPDPDDFTVSNDLASSNDIKVFGGSIHIDLETVLGNLTSITAYEGFDWTQNLDGDGGPNFLSTFAPFNQVLHQYSQELRLSNDSNPDWFWLIGGYISYDDYHNFILTGLDFDGNAANGGGFCNNITTFTSATCGPGFTPNVAFDMETFSSQETVSAAVFTHNEVQISDALKGVAGLRYTWEKRNFTSRQFFAFTPPGGPVLREIVCSFCDLGLLPSTTDDPRIKDKILTRKASFRVGIEYTPTENSLIFANVSQGFKSGGWDGNIAFTGEVLQPYKKEEVTSVEIGLKSDWLDGTMRLNATAFYTDYENPQLRKNILINGVPNTILGNIEGAEIYGIEVESMWSPASVPGLDFIVTVSLMDSETDDNDTTSANPSRFNNKELPFAAGESFTVSGRYKWPVLDNWIASIHTSVAYTSDFFIDGSNLPFEEFNTTFVRARAALASQDGKWELAVWGNNLTNDVYHFGVFQLFGARPQYTNRPRQVGVTLNYNFF